MAAVTTAVVGIASAATSAAMSFKAAAKQKKLAADADTAAAKAMAAAKAKAEKDNFAALNVPLDAYESEFENNLAAAQQSTEALQEGDSRALAAGVGKIGAAAGANAEATRITMGEEISDLNMMKAESKDAINQQLIQMDVANAKEQNMRRADSEALRAQSMQSGINSIGAGLTSAADLAPTYFKSKADRQLSRHNKQSAAARKKWDAETAMDPSRRQTAKQKEDDYEFFKNDVESRGGTF
tara:strand:+ start:3133 stop:3855 length:723 start_codon:yes stop_codon:yes gene_type:complete